MSHSLDQQAEGPFISAGIKCLASCKNEDRFSEQRGRITNNNENVSIFSVFDGHHGDAAAKYCANLFHHCVIEKISGLEKARHDILISVNQENKINKQWEKELSDIEQLDAIVCESFRAACIEMDEKAQSHGVTGSTLNSLLLIRLGDCVRAYNANVGDSRCTMFLRQKCDDILHHNKVDVLECDGYACMSEDHKLYNPRERTRIKNRELYKWQSLPFPTSILTEYPDEYEDNFTPIFHPDKMDVSKNTSAASFIAALNDYTSISNGDLEVQQLECDEEAYGVIERRIAACGRKGPEALFCKNNLSICMARSIGDKQAAKCCIAIPDVSCRMIQPGEHVRFVLGSDGVWEFVSHKIVANLIFESENLGEIATKIALEGCRLRKQSTRRVDDITVIVVDVNSDKSYPSSISPPDCACVIS